MWTKCPFYFLSQTLFSKMCGRNVHFIFCPNLSKSRPKVNLQRVSIIYFSFTLTSTSWKRTHIPVVKMMRYDTYIWEQRDYSIYFGALLLSPLSLTKYPRVSNMDLNETERWEIFKFEFVAYPRIWLFGNAVDGIWILLPIAVFGTIVNSFLVR